MRHSCFLLIAFVCALSACQKEPDGFPPAPEGCALDYVYYYSGGTVVDTVTYEYTGDVVSQANYEYWYTPLEYDNDRLVKRSYYEIATDVLAAHEELTYNTDGSLSKVDFYAHVASLPNPVLFYQYIFSYSSGTLTQLQIKMDTSGTGPVPYLEYNYEATGNNLTSCFFHDLFSDARDTVHYSYDGNANYFAKHPQRWLVDDLFYDYDGVWMPFVFSLNNVSAVTFTNGASNAITYELSDKEDVRTISMDGEVMARYFYKCQ